MAAVTLPMTSLSTSISGSHGSSGNGDRIMGRGSRRRAACWRCARSLALLRGVLLLRRFQRVIDHAQADTGELLRQLAQFRQLDRVEVGADGEQGEGRHHLILRRLLHRLAHGGGVELELVDGAAMGELNGSTACRRPGA